MLKSRIALLWAGLLSALMLGCQGSSPELIDLNRVLDLLAEVLDAQSQQRASDAAIIASDDGATGSDNATQRASGDEGLVASATTLNDAAGSVVPLDPTNVDPQAEKAFLEAFAQKLNAASLISSPMGVTMNESGEIVGFKDPNQNAAMDGGEQRLFTIQIDAEGERLIATDEQGNRRPHHYHGYGFHGFLLGTMLGRQNQFYSGERAALKPNFRSQTMSPQNYHSTAMARSKSSSFGSSSSSTRSRSGSGSFSFGK